MGADQQAGRDTRRGFWRQWWGGPVLLKYRFRLPGILLFTLVGGAIGLMVGWGAGGFIPSLGFAPIIVDGIAAGLAHFERLPTWSMAPPRASDDVIDYSVPPPEDGPLYTGRADQAVLQEWLKRRRRRRESSLAN